MKKENRSGKTSLGDFLAGKGFYIILILCVAAIGISGYFLLTGPEPLELPVAGNTELVVTPTPVPTQTAAPTPAPTPAATPTPAPTPVPTPTPEVTPTPVPTPAALVFTWPLKGEIVADYSLEVLAYDETMGDWRTHSGVDISADLGAQVLAAADGTVTAVYEDALMGTTLVIDHGQGYVSTYANLAARPTVAEGDSVTTGMVVGAVGATAPAESGRASHLHFELSRDGEAIDPATCLPDLV